ncbi:MAG: type VI secretion system contractile sheath large subunit [Gammaproteobacteria bacterium]|nr:type VI secretion system contractile sheath large subunit [Gammaproteobacteria bacterium]
MPLYNQTETRSLVCEHSATVFPVIEPPFRLWFVDNFGGWNKARRQPTAIDKQTFPHVLSAFEISFSIQLKTLITVDNAQIEEININISDLKAFKPEQIVKQNPVLNKLDTVHQFFAKLANTPSTELVLDKLFALSHYQSIQAICDDLKLKSRSQASTTTELSSLFELVDLGDDNDSDPQPDIKPAEQAIAAFNQIYSRTLAYIFSDEQFVQSERAWRGLHRFLSQVAQDTVCQFDIIDCTDDQMVETLSPFLQSTLDEQLPSIICSSFSCDYRLNKVSQLNEFARLCEQYQTPCIVNIEPGFFDSHSLADFLGYSSFNNLMDQAKYDAWNAFRNKEHARWVNCIANQIILRDAYDFERSQLTTDQTSASTAPGHWAVASLLVKSVDQTGWPCFIIGSSNMLNHDMPLASFNHQQYSEMMIPLSSWVDNQLAQDLANIGFITLQCQSNREQIYINHIPTLKIAKRYNDQLASIKSKLQNTMVYLIISARLANLLWLNKSNIFDDDHPSNIKDKLEVFLQHIIQDTGPQAKIDISLDVNSEQPSKLICNVHLKPGKWILSGEEFDLSFSI